MLLALCKTARIPAVNKQGTHGGEILNIRGDAIVDVIQALVERNSAVRYLFREVQRVCTPLECAAPEKAQLLQEQHRLKGDLLKLRCSSAHLSDIGAESIEQTSGNERQEQVCIAESQAE